jgi:hypothetical protein
MGISPLFLKASVIEAGNSSFLLLAKAASILFSTASNVLL